MSAQVDVVEAMDDACHALNTRETRDERNALIAARITIDALIDSHARLLDMARRHGLPKVADDLAPIAEARRIIAILENATARRASALAALTGAGP